MGASGDVRVRYCNVALPEQKALASRDSPMEQRLFIVSQPERFDESILKDSFCRFGNLIDAYFMPGMFLIDAYFMPGKWLRFSLMPTSCLVCFSLIPTSCLVCFSLMPTSCLVSGYVSH